MLILFFITRNNNLIYRLAFIRIRFCAEASGEFHCRRDFFTAEASAGTLRLREGVVPGACSPSEEATGRPYRCIFGGMGSCRNQEYTRMSADPLAVKSLSWAGCYCLLEIAEG